MKTKLIIFTLIIALSSCSLTSEFVPSNAMFKNQLQNTDVKLFLSELNAPVYQEIGLIRITTFNSNLMDATKEALSEIENTDANCLIYKQMAAFKDNDGPPLYVYEFIAGKIVDNE